MSSDFVLGVTDFVALLNQTLEYAYPNVTIQGELANLRVSKNKWVYFDLKDEYSSVKFFGTVFQLPGPLEDGLMVEVRGVPRLHPLYGFSVTVQTMRPVGEGSLKRAAALLEAKLLAEGLFDPARKRSLPRAPRRIGLIASSESAAYHDFVKIMNERWAGVEVLLVDVQVQGEAAPGQIVTALEYFNTHEAGVEAVVITRGGGSAEDLAAFSTEAVTRAVAASRIPTLVAIGHEVDVCLAELAADKRASTPSNAAQLLFPDKKDELKNLAGTRQSLGQQLGQVVKEAKTELAASASQLHEYSQRMVQQARQQLHLRQQLLTALNPEAPLQRGYAIVRSGGVIIRNATQTKPGQSLQVMLRDGKIDVVVE